MKFDMQRFVNDYSRGVEETTYRGRRRLSGNFGRVWLQARGDYERSGNAGDSKTDTDYTLLFEIQSFEAKITADREDVIIGQSKDSKIVSLTGEGTITLKKVFTRGLHGMLNAFKKGHDIRLRLVGTIADPDAVKNEEETVVIDNIWLNEIDLMRFEKGTVIEQTIPFGFTPDDVYYADTIDIGDDFSKTLSPTTSGWENEVSATTGGNT